MKRHDGNRYTWTRGWHRQADDWHCQADDAAGGGEGGEAADAAIAGIAAWGGVDHDFDVSGFTTQELTSVKAALGGKHGKGGRRGKGGGKHGTGGGKTDLAFGFSNWTADELLAGIAAFGPDYSNARS